MDYMYDKTKSTGNHSYELWFKTAMKPMFGNQLK